ncbi:MAG: hypothetical protein ABI358_02865 [Ginsengibacter sp.]
MLIYENSRRNFLSSMAMLSAAAICKPVIKNLSPLSEDDDLQKKWKLFWKKSGGQTFNSFVDLQTKHDFLGTAGHAYKNGETIYFSRENILAHPTWVYWETNLFKPVDVVITLVDGTSLKKISRLNRFEMEALYNLSNDNSSDNLLTAHCNGQKQDALVGISLLKSKTSFTKNARILQLSYRKENNIVINKKYIYHF